MSRPRRRRPNTPRAAAPAPAAAAAPAPASRNGQQARRGGRPQPQPQAPRTPRGIDLAAAATLSTPARAVRPTDAPDAVIRSLGAPPLPGHEVVAEHYFAAVYERSVALATALASAAGLLDDRDDPDDITGI